jgi:hypothetical protein
LSDNWKIRSVPDVPRGFAENASIYSTNFATKQYQWTNYRDLTAIIPVLLDTSPNIPTLYAVDTEFCRLESGRVKMTEAAIIDVKAGRIATSAVLDERRAVEASTKLGKFLKSQQQDASAPRHVPTTYSVAGMARQIEDCKFKESDLFVEFSTFTSNLLDVGILRSTLEEHLGDDGARLVPDTRGYAVANTIRSLLSQVMPLPSGVLQFMFRLLFPQDPLVDCNHTATVDALQLARLLRLVAELCKEPEDRKLPPDLFRGLDRLPPPNRGAVQSNTLDQYFKAKDSSSAPQARISDNSALPEEFEDRDDLVNFIESDILRVGHIADEWGFAGEDESAEEEEDDEVEEQEEEDGFEEQGNEEASLNTTSSWSKEDDIWAVLGGFSSEKDHNAEHEAPRDPITLNLSRPKRKLTTTSGQNSKKTLSSPATKRLKIR